MRKYSGSWKNHKKIMENNQNCIGEEVIIFISLSACGCPVED